MELNLQSKLCLLTLICVLTVFYQVAVGHNGSPISTRQGKKAKKATCYNLGSGDESVGPYNAEAGHVIYEKSETITTVRSSVVISNTRHEKAFQTQKSGRNLAFHVNVDEDHTYDVQLGFAQILKCNESGSDMTIFVNKRSVKDQNVFKQAGCGNARFLAFRDIYPNEHAAIAVNISGKSTISIATLCIHRRLKIAPVVRRTCGQAGCITMQGRLGVKVVSASLLSQRCRYSNFATRGLWLPSGSVIQHATLHWAVNPPAWQFRTIDTIRVNGALVTSDSLRKLSAGLYFASATVTYLVKRRGVGIYTIGSLNPAWNSIGCLNNPYAGWFLTVIYSNPLILFKRINLCASGINFYSSALVNTRMTVRCTLTRSQQRSSRAILLAFGGESLYPDLLSVNSIPIAKNAFVGRIVRSLDVVSVYFTRYVYRSFTSAVFKIDFLNGGLDYVFVVSQIVVQVFV